MATRSTPHIPRHRPSDESCRDFVNWMQRDDFVCDESGPGIVIEHNHAGLLAHHPSVSAAQSRAAIAAAIQAAGMVAAVNAQGVQSDKMFRGSVEAFTAALNALGHMSWVRHAAGQPDVGEFWHVHGSGSSIKYLHVELPFNV